LSVDKIKKEMECRVWKIGGMGYWGIDK